LIYSNMSNCMMKPNCYRIVSRITFTRTNEKISVLRKFFSKSK